MAGKDLRWQDWEHRIGLLSAWRYWRLPRPPAPGNGETYCAVLDGCSITVRALCDVIGITLKQGFTGTAPDRTAELLSWIWPPTGKAVVASLPDSERRALLEVLFLANRCVAHPKDGTLLDHKVGEPEMTSAINTVLDWLNASRTQWPELSKLNTTLFAPIS